jgi:hypothetical protein
MAREALEMSVLPWQKASKPPPVPEVPTVTLMPVFSSASSSAAASLSGKTVDEPSTATLPEAPEPSEPLLWPPHAATASASETATAPGAIARRKEFRFT